MTGADALLLVQHLAAQVLTAAEVCLCRSRYVCVLRVIQRAAWAALVLASIGSSLTCDVAVVAAAVELTHK